MLNSYRRLRHTFGHGVHSPFAYRIVTDILRPRRGYAWYGYEEIEGKARAFKDGASTRRYAEMLLRIAADAEADSAYLPEDSDFLFEIALKQVSKKFKITFVPEEARSCRLAVIIPEALPFSEVAAIASTPGSIIVAFGISPQGIDSIYRCLDHGLLLEGGRCSIFYNRPHMEKLRYTVIL